jgi:hypothetical protein
MMSNELIDFENIPNGERLELVKTECGYRVIVLGVDRIACAGRTFDNEAQAREFFERKAK